MTPEEDQFCQHAFMLQKILAAAMDQTANALAAHPHFEKLFNVTKDTIHNLVELRGEIAPHSLKQALAEEERISTIEKLFDNDVIVPLMSSISAASQSTSDGDVEATVKIFKEAIEILQNGVKAFEEFESK